MQYSKDYSKKVSDRMIEIFKNNYLMYPDELKIFQSISDKYKLLTVSDYAKKFDIAYNTVISRINSGELPYVKISEKFFILSKV